jgi:glycosyltransferase involved in cell wall biosynthesis
MILSVVITTFNEAHNIASCIQSVQALADEIIVMDSFSTDETVQIAQSMGAKVVQRKFDNYSAQKNAANALAQFDYILSIDADELLSAPLQSEILAEKNKKFPYDAYILPRLTQYCGTWIYHCGWYPDVAIRLWHKQKGLWVGALHEKVILPEFYTQKTFKHPILHYSFPTLAVHLEKANRFSTLAAQSLFEKGKTAHWTYALFSAWFTFVKKYILQKGFLDGYAGFLVCYFSALSNFLKYNKLYFLNKQKVNT